MHAAFSSVHPFPACKAGRARDARRRQAVTPTHGARGPLAADWLTLAAAWRLDRGLPADREIASAKVYASEMLTRVTDEAIRIHGGMGLMSDLPLARFWRDARVEQIRDGTSEIQRHIIGRNLLRPLGA